MPKMKTHSGAKKRFRKTGEGKLRARHAFTSHILGRRAPSASGAWAGRSRWRRPTTSASRELLHK